MLKDLKLQSHTLEALCDRAKFLGTISSIEEIHRMKLKKSVLIGKIVEIGDLIRKDGVILRDSFQVLMKELGADGKYGHEFLAILFGNIAIEAHAAKFLLSDRLLFCEPQVFMNSQFDQQKRPKLLIQVGLRHDEDEVIWYSRKHSEEYAVILASPQKTLMKINDNEEPSCSSSHHINSVKNNLSTAAGKNTKINKNNNQYNKNTSMLMKNWITKKNEKERSNVIHKRLLFARNSDAPFLSDSDVFNNSATQTDLEVAESSSPPSSSLVNNINNNNFERDSTVATCVTENNQKIILSKYFSSNIDNSKSPVKHKPSPESVMKPVVASKCDSRKDDCGGSQYDEENETSDFLNILEEVSEAMKQNYLSCTGHTKSTNESPKEVLEANRNVEEVEVVTLDDDDDGDLVELTTGTQQCRNTLFDNRETSFKPEHVILKKKKIKSNNDKKTMKPGMVFNNRNSMLDKPIPKQVTVVPSHDGLRLSPGKACSCISTSNNSNNNKCSNGKRDAQALFAQEKKRRKKLILGIKDGTKNAVHNRKIVNDKTNKSQMDSVEQKTETNEVRHKHEERLCELEASQTLFIENDKKMNDNVTSITSTANSTVLTSPGKTCHEVGDNMHNDNRKAYITSADKTTPRKLIPVLKSPPSNDKQIVRQPSRKKRVSFALSNEENDKECEATPTGNFTSILPTNCKARPVVNSKSVLANDDFADYILNVLLQSPSTNISGDSSSRDCGAATQGSEKCSTSNRNSDTVVSKHVVIGSRDTVESLKLLHDKSLSPSPADVDSDNVMAMNATHSVDEVDERRNCDYAVQPAITEEKMLKKLLPDSKKKKVFINTICVIDKSQGSGGIDSSSVADSSNRPSGSEQDRTMTTTNKIVPSCTQDSVVSHFGTKRKFDNKTSCRDDDSDSSGPNSFDLAKVQKFVSQLTPDSQQRTDFGSSSCMFVEVNWPTLSVKRDVSISTSYYSESDGDDNCDVDISGDPEGRWFVLSGASLIDVYPPLSGNTLEFVSGFCNHNCFHRYSELIWVKNDTGKSESVCPTAFKEGIRKPSPVIFLFTFIVTDREGKCYNLRVYKEHAESLLCCKVTDFITDKVKREAVIANIKSYITASIAESLMPEMVNKKQLTLCVYDKGSIQIVVRRIQTSTLKLKENGRKKKLLF